MASVYEMPNGTGGKSGGTRSPTAVTYMRKWKLVKDSPGEAYNAPAAIGVDIGSVFPADSTATCVGLDDQPDGDSRMVRIITARYESPQNTGSRDNNNDNNIAPDVRPPRIGIDSSFEMVPSQTWIINPAEPLANETETMAFQPSGELIEGLVKPARTITFTYTQFNSSDPAALAPSVGKVNAGPFDVAGTTYPKRTLLVRSVSSKPTVMDWGGQKYSGWTTTIVIAYRQNIQWVIDETQPQPWANFETEIGWDMAVPLRGMNVYNWASLNNYPIDPTGYNLYNTQNDGLVHVPAGDGAVPITVNGVLRNAFWAGTKFPQAGSYANPDDSECVAGQIGKAQVIRQTTAGTWEQADSNEPIPLNPDATPRKKFRQPGQPALNAQQAILAYRRSMYRAFDFSTLGLR